MHVTVEPVGRETWREVAALSVSEEQSRFVAEPAYYLCLCCYGELWHPLAVRAKHEIVGFLMWAIDPDDGSCWLGGILIDRAHQRRGHGRAAVTAAVQLLHEQHGVTEFALSYEPDNEVARGMYRSLGFEETGEREGDEIVARLSYVSRGNCGR